MIRYAEERVVGGEERKKEREGGWSRKSDRMSTTNLSAILREFFPRQRATSGENRALRLHSLINMQIWWHGAQPVGEGGNRGTIAEAEERQRGRKKEKAREKELGIKGGEQRGPWASPQHRDGRRREKGGGPGSLSLRKNRDSRGNNY